MLAYLLFQLRKKRGKKNQISLFTLKKKYWFASLVKAYKHEISEKIQS